MAEAQEDDDESSSDNTPLIAGAAAASVLVVCVTALVLAYRKHKNKERLAMLRALGLRGSKLSGHMSSVDSMASVGSMQSVTSVGSFAESYPGVHGQQYW